MTIPVILVDDHTMVREGLAAVLAREADIAVVGEASDGEEGLRVLMALRPAVAIVDVSLPRMSGIELTRRVREMELGCAVLLLSMHRGLEFVRAGLDAGALGYVVKDGPPAEVVTAIRAVAGGRRFIGGGVEETGLGPPLRGEPRAREVLTVRERDVLRLVAGGSSNKEIAGALGLTTRTVEWYRAALMAKLKLGSVAALVKYALKHHLASLEE